MRNLLTTISLIIIFTFFTVGNSSADPTVELTGGSLNGVAVDGGVLELTVEPGATVAGMVSISTNNTSEPSNIAPLVLVWNWGTHESAFATIDSWIPSGVTAYDVPVSLTVPDTSGTYFITFAFELEKTGAQVASLTNWRVDDGNAHWNDGIDIADWGETEYDQSVTDHFVTTLYENLGGVGYNDVPAAMVKVVAELPPQVVSFSPLQNELDVAGSMDIVVTFSEAMDESTLNAGTFIVNGSCSGQHMGVISYDDDTRTVTFDPNFDFGCGELVTVLLTTGIEAAGGTAMEQSFSWSFTAASESGGGDLVSDSTYSVSGSPHGLYSADLDNDGDLDIVTIGRDGGLTVVFNNGDGTFTVDTTYEAGFHATHVAVADFNGDLLLDVANTEVNNSKVNVHINTGGGNFTTAVKYNVGSSPGGVCAADFDGNGHIDLATSNDNGSNISVLLNTGDANFMEHQDYTTGGSAWGICCGDLDNDGDIDIVSGSWWSAVVHVSLNNGDGTFAPFVNYAVGAWPRCPVVADFDNDGNLDIAVSNYSGSSISVLLGNGDGTFAEQTAYSISYPYRLCKGDLDGDGDIDLVAPEYSDGWIKVLSNDGAGNFSLTDSVSTNYGPYGVCAADYNGDGILDIGATILSGSKLQIILNQMVTAVDDGPAGLPSEFSLRQNYPNPFNPETIIEYHLQKRSTVSLTVYNVLGQPVKTLVDETQSAGDYRAFWNGTDRADRPVATGVYFYRLKAGELVETKKMVLLK